MALLDRVLGANRNRGFGPHATCFQDRHPKRRFDHPSQSRAKWDLSCAGHSL